MGLTLYLGADHRGFRLKERLQKHLSALGYRVVDLGASRYSPGDDYVDFAREVALAMGKDKDSLGVLLCGSGQGVCMAANRFPHVRAIVGFSREAVILGRRHEDANVLCLPADFVSADEAGSLATAFLTTAFGGEQRHRRRLTKLLELAASD